MKVPQDYLEAVYNGIHNNVDEVSYDDIDVDEVNYFVAKNKLKSMNKEQEYDNTYGYYND